MDAQRRIRTDPAGFTLVIDEGDADGHVDLGVGQMKDFLLGFVTNRDPLFFHRDRVEFPGPDFLNLEGVDLGKTAHHLEQEQWAEPLVLAASGPHDGL